MSLKFVSKPKWNFIEVELWLDEDDQMFLLRYRWGNSLGFHTSFWNMIQNMNTDTIQLISSNSDENNYFKYLLEGKSAYPDVNVMYTFNDLNNKWDNDPQPYS